MYLGQAISPGIACGKAKFLAHESAIDQIENDVDQMEFFHRTLKSVTTALEESIDHVKARLNDRISDIFETQKMIVNDPIVIQDTINYISLGMNALEAYTKTIEQVLTTFQKIDNEYMLGRVVDILDATDKVKAALQGSVENMFSAYSEDVILVLDQPKPSVIYSTGRNHIVGFVSAQGFYHQHSGMIARAINVPGIVYGNILKIIKDNDIIIINGDTGELLINPNDEEKNKFYGGIEHEL